MRKKTLLITGGTGGHVIPAVNFCNYLTNKDEDCKIVTDIRGSKYIFVSKKNIFIIKSSSLTGNIFVKITGVLHILSGFIRSILIIIKYRPNKVISFGSYASLTPMLACLVFKKFFGIKLYIHEQNTILGRTNKLFVNFVDKIFLNFDIRNKFNEKLILKSHVVGSPEKDIKPIKESNNIDKDLFTIFVYGGSQGSEFLINFTINLVKLFNNTEIKKYNFIIQCPSKIIKNTEKILKTYDCKFLLQEYYRDIESILKNSSLVISRAGAGTINDLIKYKKPSILIPLPGSKDNHQDENAKILSNNNLALNLNQIDNDFNKARKYIKDLINDNKKIIEIKENFKKIEIKNANELIYKLVTDE